MNPPSFRKPALPIQGCAVQSPGDFDFRPFAEGARSRPFATSPNGSRRATKREDGSKSSPALFVFLGCSFVVPTERFRLRVEWKSLRIPRHIPFPAATESASFVPFSLRFSVPRWFPWSQGQSTTRSYGTAEYRKPPPGMPGSSRPNDSWPPPGNPAWPQRQTPDPPH
jgi:hypothetical protein